MTDEQHKFEMVIGRGKMQEAFLIECSHPLSDVRQAYDQACRYFEYDPIASLCDEEDDGQIPKHFAERLVAAGFRQNPHYWTNFFEDMARNDREITANSSDWIRMIMFMASKHLMDFGYDILQDESDVWNVGGIGTL